MASKEGLLDLDAHDYNMVFDTNVNLNLSKADRLIYGDSSMTHAMVLTGFRVDNYETIPNGKANNGEDQEIVEDKDGMEEMDDKIHEKITKWRVENYWGENKHEKGYLAMTNECAKKLPKRSQNRWRISKTNL